MNRFQHWLSAYAQDLNRYLYLDEEPMDPTPEPAEPRRNPALDWDNWTIWMATQRIEVAEWLIEFNAQGKADLDGDMI